MLVLSRKRGERIVIGPDVELTVVDVRGGTVRLGFDAPPEVSIHRQEIHRRIQEEGRGSDCDYPCDGEHPRRGRWASTTS